MKPTRLPIRFLVSDVSKNPSQRSTSAVLTSAIAINDQVFKYKCIIKDFWSTCPIENGDYVNVFNPKILDEHAESEFVSTLIIDNADGLLVVKPDILISATTLMSASFCMRKSWLSRLFEIFGEPNKAMIIGNVVHELFQESLKRNYVSVVDITNLFMNELLKTLTLDLYAMGMSREDVIAEIKPYLLSISNWLKIYTNKESTNTMFDIHRLHEIENTIWSTKYGFIGKLDLSLEVNMRDATNTIRSRSLIPLELKTGRHTFSTSHMGQVILYSFIMTDKYPNLKPPDGFLLYLKDDPRIEKITTNHNVFRDLIILRNQFVQHYDKFGGITEESLEKPEKFASPDPIVSDRTCQKCEHLLDCSLTYRCFDLKASPNKIFTTAEAALMHLNTEELDFFTRSVTLLEIEKQHCLEDEDFVYFWNIRSEECEFSGIGLSKMQIKSQTKQTITFHRNTKAVEMLHLNLLSSNSDLEVNYSLLEGRRAVISEELFSSKKTFEIYGSFCKQLCVIIGKIDSFSNDLSCIEISLEKEQLSQLNPNAIYRIDFLKNLSNRAMQINYSNICRLMTDDLKAKELRDVIIRGHVPKLNVSSCKVPSFKQILDSSILNKLNVQQKKAVIGVLKTKFSLIFGSPGSGKTQTIVALIQILVSLGYSVLVTSFTHVAVDNILLKLVQANEGCSNPVDFVRIGSTKRIHTQLQKYSDHCRTKVWLEQGDLSAIEKFYATIPVVASTCLGVFGHPVFLKKNFDFCILDEASQVFLTSSLGPLFFSNNFVLVGDQKQLPPVIKNKFARKSGLEESLFARLLNFADKGNLLSSAEDVFENFERFESYISESKTVSLNTIRVFPLFIQYRMNCVIMELANRLTYSGNLKCANDQVESTSMQSYIKENGSPYSSHRKSYLEKALSPHLEDSVVFLNSEGIVDGVEISYAAPPLASQGSGSNKPVTGIVYNDFEANIIVQLVQSLFEIYHKGGLAYSNIGIISPFQRQVMRIRELFGDEFIHQNHLEINTVDQYQGRDKDIIIYSCVKSHSFNDGGESQDSRTNFEIIDSSLLKDERRLNVAITRAKKKLIIIGNRNTLNRYEPFQKLFTVLQANQSVNMNEFEV